jgi:hypothetical protein
MQWFRLYSDITDNHKLRMLAFEDRWHFVAVLACNSAGLIKGDNEFLERSLAVKLGVQLRELDEIKRRLMDVKLIDKSWKPIGWDERQYVSDSSANRTRKYREKQKLSKGVTSPKRHSDVTVTPPDTDTDTEQKQKQKKQTVNWKEIQRRVAALGVDWLLFREFLTTRQTLKARNTPYGLKVLLNKIEDLVTAGENATSMIEESNSNGWKTVYPAKRDRAKQKSAVDLATDNDW